MPDMQAQGRTCSGGGRGLGMRTRASPCCRVANLALRRGSGLFASTLGEASLVLAIFEAMCCTKLEKTSSVASVTPTAIVRTCGTLSISCNSVVDSGCDIILQRDVLLRYNQLVGFVKTFPSYTGLFTTRTELK